MRGFVHLLPLYTFMLCKGTELLRESVKVLAIVGVAFPHAVLQTVGALVKITVLCGRLLLSSSAQKYFSQAVRL